MTYRARSVPPASDWGRFLVRMRMERDWSAVEAHEALHDGLGLKLKSKASYTALEDGKEPSAAQERFLRDYFGSGPTEQDRAPEQPPEQESLASAIRGLTDELRLLREAQSQSGAATADLVALAIRETLRAAGLVVEPQ